MTSGSPPQALRPSRSGGRRKLAQLIIPKGDNVVRWAAYAILFTVMVFYILDPNSRYGEPRFYITLLSLAGLLLVNIFWDDLCSRFASDVTGNWILLGLSVALALLATWAGVNFSGLYLVLMISAQATIMLQRLRPSLALIAVLVAGYLGILVSTGIGWTGIVNVSLSMLTGLVFVIALSQVLLRYSEQTQRAERLLAELQAANAELLAARQREKSLAIAEERVRLAREIHDGLGHHLTALSIQLQAAEKLITSDPLTAADAVRMSRREVQAALKEVRQSVAALRHTPVDGRNLPDSLAELVREFEQRTSIHTTLTCSGAPASLTPVMAETIFRAVQEGLTNTQKHAQHSSHVEVELAVDSKVVRLRIANDGQNMNEAGPEGGFGLVGIRERVSQLDGHFEHGPLPGQGYHLSITIPLNEHE